MYAETCTCKDCELVRTLQARARGESLEERAARVERESVSYRADTIAPTESAAEMQARARRAEDAPDYVSAYIGADGWLRGARDDMPFRRATWDECCSHAVGARFMAALESGTTEREQ